MANNCQVSTPGKYVIQLLNYVKYKDNVFGKTVLENSCGEGKILIEIVKQYIKDARKKKISNEQIVCGIERDIAAFEIDEKKFQICIGCLNKLVKEMGLLDVNWNIKNEDFLKQPIQKYDYIIGNPPYITYHDLDEDNREYLRNHFSSCKEGRFDYSYAFIEKSIMSLKENGKLIYLLPYSVIKNKSANILREYMFPFITEIYDYAGIKVFPDVTTSSIVLLIENRKSRNKVGYYGMANGSRRKIPRSNLKGKWKFAGEKSGEGERFGDYFDVYNSVATLYNKAYVLEDYTICGNYYYINGMPIESGIVYPAISTKSYNKSQKNTKYETAIIFPYKTENGETAHYLEKEFETGFPMTVRYLKTYMEGLNNRKSDKNALWFEYGRSQAVSKVFGEKLVMPMVVTNRVSVCRAASDMIPFAGYFIKCKEGSAVALDQAEKILESSEFYEYVKACGTPTTPTSYRISVDDIKEYRF